MTPPAGTAQDAPHIEFEGELDPNRTVIPSSGGGGAEDDDFLNLGLHRVGGYRIQSMLGRGGMGVVTLALAPDDSPVALKLLPPECLDELGRQRFTREQEALGRVNHKHVVALKGAGFDEATRQPYIAMEWVQGISLHDLLERLGKLSPAESIFLLKAVAEGLAAAHAEGVIHRDLKPSNVIVTPDGGVKLIDFGLALSEDITQRLTRRGYVVGTRSFIPPEVLEQDQPWTAAADCFALGVLGSYFLGGHEELIVAELSQTPYEDPYEVVPKVETLPGPDELRALLGALRERDPDLRPDAETAATRLAAIEPLPAALSQLLAIVGEFTQAELDGLMSKTSAVGAASSSRPSRRLEVGHEFDGYRVEAEISRGSMGAVFRAHHEALDRSVAIKVLLAGDMATPEERGRFLREAEASGALDHPNVVKVLDAGEARGAQFMVMELVTGGSLRERVPKGEGLDPDEALKLFEGICAGVNHAHSRGVIHRDLKPENVMLAEDGRPQVTDFGLAKRVEEEGGEGDHLTVDGALMGTVAYMAPEQARGQMRTLDVRADVYALGVMFYELLCGQLPFSGHFAQLIDRKLRMDPPPLRKVAPSVPWELEAICLRAMEREPARRYPTVQSLIEDVERYKEGLPVQARSAGLLYRARKWVGRHLWGVSLFAAFLIAAGGALANTLWAVRERERLEAERHEQEAEGREQEAREAQALEDQKRREGEAKVAAEAKRVALHEQRVRDAVGSAWEAAAIGSYTLAAERFQVASELVGGEPVAMNLDELPVPNRLRQDLNVSGPEFVTPSLLREWSRGTRTASAAAKASRLLSSGRTLRAEARAGYRSGADPVAVRKLYFLAIDELRGSLRHVPDFKDALHEQKGLSREFAAVLIDLGYSELAEFVLLMGGGEKLDDAQKALPRDPILDVIEADKVTARHRYGGRVFFRPTQAFAALRLELARRAPNLRCTLRIRTEIVGDGGRILRLGIKGVEVQVGDRVAGTVRPIVVVLSKRRGSVRPVSLDTRGFRVVAPLEQTRNFELKQFVAAVRAAVLKEAQLGR